MRRELSTYLDLVRFLAAMAVVVSHFTLARFMLGLPYQGALGRIAVSTFFVLSGYVIAYVADQKEHTLREFAISRMARIYSVAIPALVLTIVTDLYLLHQGIKDEIPIYEYDGIWKYLPIFLSFTSEIGTIHAPVFSNSAFWSLSYEVWYYVAFGVAFYLRGIRRVILLAVTLAILGLPALLYFPMWLIGAACYRLHQRRDIRQGLATVGAVVTATLAIGLLIFGFYDWADITVDALLNDWLRAHLHNSTHFPSNYVAGILVAMNFYYVRYCNLSFLSGPRLRNAITYLASFTFAIYLAHYPFLCLWFNLLHHDLHSPASLGLLFILVMTSIWCFGFVSEKQKNRWRDLFRWLFSRFKTSRPEVAT